MFRITCTMGPASVTMESDDSLHPEFVETLMTKTSVQTAIMFDRMVLAEQDG